VQVKRLLFGQLVLLCGLFPPVLAGRAFAEPGLLGIAGTSLACQDFSPTTDHSGIGVSLLISEIAPGD
jgi:Na+/H+-translocating membrane pyrophosphatase